MVKTADEILKELESAIWQPAKVRIRFIDKTRSSLGQTDAMPLELAYAKLEALKRHNSKAYYWIEEADEDDHDRKGKVGI